MKTSISIIAAFLAIGLSGKWVSNLDPIVHPKVVDKNLNVADEKAAASLLGQFRTSITSWLWLRTDLYLHNGVEMRRLTDGEIKSGIEGAHHEDHDDDSICEDGVMQTVVPPASRDFRGILGDVERAATAYQDMSHHEHNNPKSALPLFKLMTLIEPTFEPAWVVGGSILSRDKNSVATARAEQFLREGLFDNPNSIAIRVQIAELLIVRKKELAGAEELLKAAIVFGLANRTHLREEEMGALQNAFRWMALCERDLGHYSGLKATVEAGLKLFPHDLAMPRILRDAGMPPIPTIFSPKFQKKLEKDAARSAAGRRQNR